ncbi:aminopeptidase [Chryseobacterium indologenes]|uniref:M1 family aminopeptidase n=1 Tax=Chryseobacterium indologenes TaxID=253 RepID=UPI000F4EFFAA|nr:M1 family aminopeptidase [Chryseobacterium indologenes]AYZ36724.1 aminopeptidase [Chryseobacterium indologenes]MBF6645503.1 aminopeptidase [Chryseobacterium indologenes]MBU3049247.1 aminopeptidase [Chryseobacterium indologenes]MEB4760291.1 M1 family aminopeptidase [Chryseobacterium indologenes]QQQ70822.1 aminopeptidase [Chryseobacterium indologenes]
MNTIFLFEAGRSSKHWLTYLVALLLIALGIFCGNQFNLSVGEGIYLNSPYTVGFMTGMLSLSIILFATVYALQLLFKDHDTRFAVILFSFPVSKLTYLTGRFTMYFLKTFISFCLMMSGFIIGRLLRTGSEMQEGFRIIYYLYPILIFGLINSLLVCSFLFLIALSVRKKLFVVISGLFLYILYMIVLLFSNSPFMTGSIPQSLEAQQFSAIVDPFGLSSYFFDARTTTVLQKNTELVHLSGYLLLNRILFVLISLIFISLSIRLFSFSSFAGKKGKKILKVSDLSSRSLVSKYQPIVPGFGLKAFIASIFSYAKIDLIYLFKSITVPAISILLLFCIGMELYAEIEKGIRIPQKYASSGLMATTISENFPLFGLLISAYFLNDLYWRSHSSAFCMIENTAFLRKNKLSGHLIAISILLFLLTGILIAQGIIFQAVYQYFYIDWNAYLPVFLFTTFPLILFSGFILLINDNFRNKFVALGISVFAVLVLAGPVSGKILPYPLLRFFSDFKGSYSDFNGYGTYMLAFTQRLVFGVGVIASLWTINTFIISKRRILLHAVLITILLIFGLFAGMYFMKGYLPKDEDKIVMESVEYEKKYRKYENLPQPDITDVTTEIKLYPSENAYQITGKYTVRNQTGQPVHKVLINFHPDLHVENATFILGNEVIKVNAATAEIMLKNPMQPNDTGLLNFKLFYKWYAVNGHQSFNAIIGDGSFMRISRYYPTLGYQKHNEVQDQQQRNHFQLGKLTPMKSPEDPEVFKKDFINLDMTISTEKNQTAIGTGDLVKKWTKSGRLYFKYKADQIPFRFAVSSANYRIKSERYKGITINIFYHQKHFENVNHLLKNAKLTLDYCQQNFAKYPFKTISFAEISSFTRGFAATAYPSAIFMPEDMIFHANIQADKKQDVINELAGHELSHLWWGNNQIDPDEREGSVMLTETLAMYTEMVLYKKMYGREKMMERILVHQQIYNNEKGLSENRAIYKATGDVPHIAYSKGAVAMVRLSDLLGEDKLNIALKNFLNNNRYPKKPTSVDLLNEFYKVSPDPDIRKQIDFLFKTTRDTPASSTSESVSVKEKMNIPIDSF